MHTELSEVCDLNNSSQIMGLLIFKGGTKTFFD